MILGIIISIFLIRFLLSYTARYLQSDPSFYVSLVLRVLRLLWTKNKKKSPFRTSKNNTVLDNSTTTYAIFTNMNIMKILSLLRTFTYIRKKNICYNNMNNICLFVEKKNQAVNILERISYLPSNFVFIVLQHSFKNEC